MQPMLFLQLSPKCPTYIPQEPSVSAVDITGISWKYMYTVPANTYISLAVGSLPGTCTMAGRPCSTGKTNSFMLGTWICSLRAPTGRTKRPTAVILKLQSHGFNPRGFYIKNVVQARSVTRLYFAVYNLYAVPCHKLNNLYTAYST